jgi:DNA-directed RNA polymerase specialized sigma54-like protein
MIIDDINEIYSIFTKIYSTDLIEFKIVIKTRTEMNNNTKFILEHYGYTISSNNAVSELEPEFEYELRYKADLNINKNNQEYIIPDSFYMKYNGDINLKNKHEIENRVNILKEEIFNKEKKNTLYKLISESLNKSITNNIPYAQFNTIYNNIDEEIINDLNDKGYFITLYSTEITQSSIKPISIYRIFPK